MILLIVIIALSLIFDFINGFHDAANSIATIVSTKVLTPFQAVIWAALFNFAAFFIFKEHGVANTVAKTVFEQYITLPIVLSGILAAITWNLFTWWYGIPSSSSHTLIGGFAGAAIGHAGFNSVNYSVILETIVFIVAAPIIGMIIASIVTLIIVNLFKNTRRSNSESWFKRLQLLSSAGLSLGHGGSDAQKVMGIITVALIATHHIHKFSEMPTWVPLACYTAISCGTLSGGWKIVKTMGTKITKVTPLEGVAAETAGAITLFITTHFQIPVSTTHTIAGSIIGVGLTKRVSAVRWGVTISLLWAWVLTIPVSATIAIIIMKLIDLGARSF